jgi:hypothetical protein
MYLYESLYESGACMSLPLRVRVCCNTAVVYDT